MWLGHHETVYVGCKEDDIQDNTRKGLNIKKVELWRPKRSTRATQSGSEARVSGRTNIKIQERRAKKVIHQHPLN